MKHSMLEFCLQIFQIFFGIGEDEDDVYERIARF